ncbi:jg21417, partial [Pararge aegeria aegeria]
MTYAKFYLPTELPPYKSGLMHGVTKKLQQNYKNYGSSNNNDQESNKKQNQYSGEDSNGQRWNAVDDVQNDVQNSAKNYRYADGNEQGYTNDADGSSSYINRRNSGSGYDNSNSQSDLSHKQYQQQSNVGNKKSIRNSVAGRDSFSGNKNDGYSRSTDDVVSYSSGDGSRLYKSNREDVDRNTNSGRNSNSNYNLDVQQMDDGKKLSKYRTLSKGDAVSTQDDDQYNYFKDKVYSNVGKDGQQQYESDFKSVDSDSDSAFNSNNQRNENFGSEIEGDKRTWWNSVDDSQSESANDNESFNHAKKDVKSYKGNDGQEMYSSKSEDINRKSNSDYDTKKNRNVNSGVVIDGNKRNQWNKVSDSQKDSSKSDDIYNYDNEDVTSFTTADGQTHYTAKRENVDSKSKDAQDSSHNNNAYSGVTDDGNGGIRKWNTVSNEESKSSSSNNDYSYSS